MKDLAAIGASTLQLDVTDGQEVLDRKTAEAIGKFGHIDVVVHNAGRIQFGTTEDLRCVAAPPWSHAEC